MNEKILVIHPGYTRTGNSTFQEYILKSLNVNILAQPIEDQTRTIWFKLLLPLHYVFKKWLIKNLMQP